MTSKELTAPPPSVVPSALSPGIVAPSRSATPSAPNLALEEYKELGQNIRQYATLRFAQLTIFVAASAGLVTAAFGARSSTTIEQAAASAAGLVITAAFYAMEASAVGYWRRFKDRAVELERELGFVQYTTNRHPRPRVNATTAVAGLFLTAGLYWMGNLFRLAFF
ncbi:MAG TPA: hypothetical protein VN428_16760 [Bryobacteraceae bacterium]|nr:hypothetical protein [Bryobacteraceae bacterium]